MANRAKKPAKASGKPGRRRKTGLVPISQVPISSLCPSPDNDQLYRPVDPADSEIIALAESIRELGLLEPLVVTADGYIVSGHRRHAAARLAGLSTVPARVLPLRRDDDPDEFVRLLREHNRQRDKTNAEKLREELVSVNREDAVEELYEYRRATAAVGVKAMELGVVPIRSAISAAKAPMVAAVLTVLTARRDFWPLSDRQIHYALLNDPPLRHARKPNSTYDNTLQSYKSLTELLTRMRLDRMIPFAAIGDETRPVQVWDVHQSPRSFVEREMAGMFKGYSRDLMQSQPNHIEILGEKNTVGSILRPVASEYTIPLTTGRGYCSLPPRYDMAWRFERSGKEKLVLLIASDFDPDGEEIAHSFARSMRDDFGIEKIHAIKVALTAQQVKMLKLPRAMKAKTKSSNYKKFVSRHGDDVFELEALAPQTLQEILRETIESVIDRDAYSAEIEAERNDAAFLAAVRTTARESLKGIDLEGSA